MDGAAMRRRLVTLACGVALAAAVGVGVVVAAVPAGASDLPVSYDFALSAVTAGINANADPPGANNWSCHPSAAHPEPVVLVHGTGGNKNTNWQTYAPLLANNGYCVFALTYGTLSDQLPMSQIGGLGPIEAGAAQLAAFVDTVLAATGARKVDIVGHSQGTLMPDYYAKFLGGASKIDKYVSLSSLWHGSDVLASAQLAQAGRMYGFPVDNAKFFGAGTEMLTGSAFMTKMRTGGVAVPGITYTNIVTKYDELVVPYTSGIEPGMRNIRVQDQCALDYTEHAEMAADPIASVDVLNALDPAHPRAVPCEVVLPFVGP
jgi:triacylglycerol lipase